MYKGNVKKCVDLCPASLDVIASVDGEADLPNF